VRDPIKKMEKTPVIPRRANAVSPGLKDVYKPYYNTRPLKQGPLDVLKKASV